MTSKALEGRCGAKGRRGNPCKKTAGWGTDHPGIGRCKLHGGNTPSHRKAALRTMLMEETQSAFFGAGAPVDISPTEALLELVRMTAGYVRWLSNEMSRQTRYEYEDDFGKKDMSVLARLLGEYTDRLARLAKMTLDAGVEERLVRVAEAQGEMMAAVLVNVLSDLALTPAQQRRAPDIVRTHLLALEAPSRESS